MHFLHHHEDTPVVIYTTPFCSYCRAAKKLLDDNDFDYIEVDLSKKPDSVRQELIAQTGHRTVPMIIVNEFFIGGYDELRVMHNTGEFDKLYYKELSENEHRS